MTAGLVPDAVPGTDRTTSRRRRVPGQPGSWPAWALIAFSVVLVVVPLGLVIAYSVMKRGQFGVGVAPGFQLESYQRLVYDTDLSGVSRFDGRYLQVFLTSGGLALATTVLCTLVAVPTAIWMATRSARTRNLMVLVITIPFWTNTLIRTYAWMLVLADNGLVNRAGQGVGLIDEPLHLLYTPFATLVGLVYVFLPFLILPVYASAERLDLRLVEAAYDLGAKRLTVLRRIVLPAIRPGLIAGVVLVFIPALGAFLQPDLLGGGKTLMLGNLISQQFGASRNWPFGSAVAVALLVITLLALMGLALASRRVSRRPAVTP